MDKINTPLTDEFLGLRARYDVLMEMPIEGTIAMHVWFVRLEALITDIKRSSFQIAEVMHP